MFGFKSRAATPVTSGVRFFNGQTGDVGYAPVIPAATAAALALVPTAGALTAGGLQVGQPAFVLNTGRLYYLQAKVTATPDGLIVIATVDDPLRQWCVSELHTGQGRLTMVTPEIDLTVPQTIVLFPPLTGRVGYFPINVPGLLTVKNGTVTTGPTIQAGANAGINDWSASAVVSTFATLAAGQRTSLAGVAPAPFSALDASAGVRLQITVGSVLGTATQHKARFFPELSFY